MNKKTNSDRLLTQRQEMIFKRIIEEYTNTAVAVGSHVLQEKFFNNLSSATIRNEMSELEKNEFIVKTYSSSGRIPTLKGYKYYNDYLNDELVPETIKIQIQDLLSKRNLSIDQVINQSVDIISKSTNLLSVSTNVFENDLLKKIDLVILDDKQAILIIVTSSGNIIKKEIFVNEPINFEDISICVNVFNDRLVDTPLSQINEKLVLLKDLIRDRVKSYEFIIHEIVEKIFNEIDWTNIHVSSSENALLLPEFNDVNKLKQLLFLLKDVSIWKQIGYNKQITGKTSICFKEDIGIDDVSIVSTNVELKNSSRQIAVIGPSRITHAKAKTLLEFLKSELERNYK